MCLMAKSAKSRLPHNMEATVLQGSRSDELGMKDNKTLLCSLSELVIFAVITIGDEYLLRSD